MSEVTFLFGGWEPVLRIVTVGTLAYLALVLMLRITGTRTLAQLNAFDFIVTVAIGASFGRILTARSVALVEAIAAFALLILLQYAVTWLKVRSRSFSRAVTARPAMLFYKGEFLERAMVRARVTHGEIETALREKGVGGFGEVEAVVLESNGKLAVIQKDGAGDGSALPARSEDSRAAEVIVNES